VPAIVEPGLQRRAEAALEANKHRASPERVGARRYLLSGLVRCGICDLACSGRTTTSGGKNYSYYGCMSNRRERGPAQIAHLHSARNVSAPWLENLVWADVKRFITNPGEVLERVRDQLGGEGDAEELAARLKSLGNRLAAKQSEKDRYIRLYAQGHISEAELETYLADLKNQISNLRLLIEATEADLSQKRERAELADTTYAWLAMLRERAEEIEEETPEAFLKRQQLVRLLVDGITVGRGEDGEVTVEITYRFGPPDETPDGEYGFVGNVQNSSPNVLSR
jgi:site-specific DNA recombinase